LKQRVVLRCTLTPFALRDAVEYIDSRLARVGMPDQKVFSEELLAEIHRRAQGIPRVINGICDNLLLTAFAMETKVCTEEMLDEVCKDMRLDWPGSRRVRGRAPAEEFERAPYKV
jgi:general secretion pathway protein A